MVRTTAEKLQIKPNTELLLGPCSPAQRGLLDPLPEGVTVVDGIVRDTTGVVMMFAADRENLDTLLAQTFPLLRSPRAIWVGYLKGNRSDINRDSIWARAEDFG